MCVPYSALVACLVGTVGLGACAGAPRQPDGPVSHRGLARRFDDPARLLAAVARHNDRYRTMRAVHKVAIEIVSGDGRRQRLSCSGVVAVQRPDRYRLTAVGALGVKLFDLLYRRGRVELLAVAPQLQAESDRLPAVLRSIAEDVRALYRLEPRPRCDQRTVEEGIAASSRAPLLELYERRQGRVVRQLTVYATTLAVARAELTAAGDRLQTITYADYERTGGVLVPHTMLVASDGTDPYWVSIRVARVELDVELDPRLFTSR